MCCWLLLLILGIAPALAQDNLSASTRNGKTLSVKLMGGLNVYGGDTDGIPHYNHLSIIELGQYFQSIGVSGRLEVAYALNKRFDVALAGEYGRYPNIEPGEVAFAVPFNAGQFNDDKRLHIELLGRMNILPDSRINPYVQAGANVALGHEYEIGTFNKKTRIGFGPSFGGGIEAKITNRFSVVAETAQNLIFPDAAIDGADYRAQFGAIGDDQQSDWLSFYGLGAKMDLGSVSGCKPVDIANAIGSHALKVGEAGNFTASINQDASMPSEYYWDFGDGNVLQGLSATHAYAKAGAYTITFSATNCGGTDVASFPVTVESAQPKLQVSAVLPSTTSGSAGEAVRFSADVKGDGPFTYRWNFGDGSTSTAANPSHVYNAPGTYTVILEVQNATGVERRMQTIEIKKGGFDPCDSITELNSVYFAFGSSTLDANAQSRLMENVDVLKGCSKIMLKLNGYTDHLEPNAMTLSQRRAQAVADFYLSKGIPGNRIGVSGRGKDAVSCDKEDPGKGCRRNRRVESLPNRM